MKKIMIAMLLISLFIMPKQSLALKCVEPSPPNIAYDEYDAVIIGEVEKIKKKIGGKVLTIKVQKSFKGVDKNIIKVKEDRTWGKSQLNSEYLYFLNKEGENWVNPLCSPTTNDTKIADEFLVDREIITLQNVDSNEDELKRWGLIVFSAALFTIVLVAFFIKKRKNK
ncbi:hypothetical protein CSE16_08480 [Solibacillus sp. R5-41]|uniref:hypothetical protein n=1 Tax=Solibacillus sp. R5-41 TaxID=2048654 RepID=UPI000C1269CE|nr:hypothetical protein [Solibacillus sp. R5-41]ATP40082.1 hypothetical protein CSE16_08480 [Solibacillus sp. R5-41]